LGSTLGYAFLAASGHGRAVWLTQTVASLLWVQGDSSEDGL
jgi:hypothetical protein